MGAWHLDSYAARRFATGCHGQGSAERRCARWHRASLRSCARGTECQKRDAMIYPDLSVEVPAELGRVHFVGIGGSGMSGIARMMHAAGVTVTGSDRSANYSTEALEKIGIPVKIGHDAANIGDADTLVVTGALWEDNPEYQRALTLGI